MHHPELEDVWGDLETKVKPVKPEEAEQPEGLKVTLLPFQRESLHWMRKQEAGPWTGGMLAVSSCTSYSHSINLQFCWTLGRDGNGQDYPDLGIVR